MTRFALRFALVCLVLSALPACGRKPKKAPAVPAAPVQQPTRPTVAAPPSVPQSLVDRVQRDWPTIEKEGQLFLAKFAQVQAAQGDRARMDPLIDEAKQHYENALESWNEIYYSVDDMPEAQAEACRRYLGTWNKQVDSWTSKAKALKEFSRVQ